MAVSAMWGKAIDMKKDADKVRRGEGCRVATDRQNKEWPPVGAQHHEMRAEQGIAAGHHRNGPNPRKAGSSDGHPRV
jgi:hypothetical protein